jgi:hypothetical protein
MVPFNTAPSEAAPSETASADTASSSTPATAPPSSAPGGDRRHFSTTLGGAVAHGRRRLRTLLGLVLVVMLAVAIAAFAVGRGGAGLVALVVAVGPLFAIGLVGETGLEGLQVGRGVLVIERTSGQEPVALAGNTARRLTQDEIRHLERLAESAGIVAGTGGYDSTRLGELDLYASDLSNAVLVECPLEESPRRTFSSTTPPSKRRLVVTPDDPEAFLAALADQQ